MFDIGFFELLVTGVVALLVIGPERLPALARTAGRWAGKAQSVWRSVKADLDREITAQDNDTGNLLETGKELNNLFDEVRDGVEQVACDFHLDASGQMAPPQADRQAQTPGPSATGPGKGRDTGLAERHITPATK